MISKLFKKKKNNVNNDDEFTAEAMARISEDVKSSDFILMKRDVKDTSSMKLELQRISAEEKSPFLTQDFCLAILLVVLVL